jgi:hypothetical protein
MTHGKSPEDDRRTGGTKLREWLIPVITALIGVAGTIGVGFIRSSSETVDVITGSSPAPATKTVSARPAPAPATVTITVSPSPVSTDPGPVTLPDCPVSQGCQAFNLVVHPSISGTEVDLGTGVVGDSGDFEYRQLPDGATEIEGNGDDLGAGVTPQQANMQGCGAITKSNPTGAILGLHKGLFFCVATFVSGSGVSLVEQTRPVSPTGMLYLTERYWPNDG